MTFEEMLDHAIAMLQRRGRLTYGTLKRQFQLDDAALADLTDALIYGQCVAADEGGRVLVWTGAAGAAPPEAPQAVAHYQQALALAAELGMRPLVAHCHRGLGTLYAATGQREQARSALSMAIEMYRAMDMTFWLPQAEAMLAEVSG
jgi:tetratricopeptide (TPR) repeat protein